jgi:hypothetical protein
MQIADNKDNFMDYSQPVISKTTVHTYFLIAEMIIIQKLKGYLYRSHNSQKL